MKKIFMLLFIISSVAVLNGQITNRCQLAQIGQEIQGHCQTHAYWTGNGLAFVSYCDTDVLISGPGEGSGCVVSGNEN